METLLGLETVVSSLLDRRADMNLPIIFVLDCCLLGDATRHSEDLRGASVGNATNVAFLSSITIGPEEGLTEVNCSPYTHLLLQHLERGLVLSEINSAIVKELASFGRRQVRILEKCGRSTLSRI